MTEPRPDPPPLTVYKVALIGESLRTYREVNGLHPSRYPVIVWLSRPPLSYEQVKLAQAGIAVDSTDPMQVRFDNTTLEEVREAIPGLNAQLKAAVGAAKLGWEAAQAEDGRLIALSDTINADLDAQLNVAPGEAV
jgi:hypothetical protein